jgi:hypothetical protein
VVATFLYLSHPCTIWSGNKDYDYDYDYQQGRQQQNAVANKGATDCPLSPPFSNLKNEGATLAPWVNNS